jgi:hypothetical protein
MCTATMGKQNSRLTASGVSVRQALVCHTIHQAAILGSGTDPTPSDAVELCQNASFSGGCEGFVYPGSNDQCQSPDRMAGNSDSLRFLGNYVGNYHVVLYHDSACSVYLSGFDSDSSDFGLSKSQYSGIKINYTGSSQNGIQFCDQPNYGSPCVTLEEGKYNLSDTSIESVQFLGSFEGHDHVVLHENADQGGNLVHLDASTPLLTV